MKNVHLLVIDPQVDFCDPNGSLFVPGADADMSRAASMVRRLKDKVSAIHVTLDSHHTVDIAHPIFWKDANGAMPNPFTIITASDVEDGTWTTKTPSHLTRALDYVRSLESNGRYPLCIWPPHCLIGSKGANVVPELFEALVEWENRFKVVNYVTKGSNPWTEHYSAIQADVPDPADVTTQLNTGLIKVLEDADEIIIMGEALSNCLKFTVEDIANNFADESYVGKFTLLEDATSSIQIVEHEGTKFIEGMVKRGMQVSTTKDIFS
jgi:nicotinamidase/pyrazinamidase